MLSFTIVTTLAFLAFYFSPEAKSEGEGICRKPFEQNFLCVCLCVCLSVNLSITPKRLEMDPAYGVSPDHKFYEECPRHNFLSVCLAGCLAVWLS